jgi:gas vesicle protein
MLNYSNIDISSGIRTRNCINLKKCIILLIFIIISIIGGYLYQDEKQLKISIKNNLRNLEENLTSVYIETFSDFNVSINNNFKDTIEDFKKDINDNIKDTIENFKKDINDNIKDTIENFKKDINDNIKDTIENFKKDINDNIKDTIEDFKKDINDNIKDTIKNLEIPIKENNKYVSTIKNIMIKNKIDEILMDVLYFNRNNERSISIYYEKIREINLNFKHCFPASNIYNIFESLIDIDYENNIFSFNYDKETDTEENELDNINPTSKLAKIINENLSINNYSYSPCDKNLMILYYNYDNIKDYNNKMQCNFGYFEDIYFDNERYYFTFQNTLFYSTINSNECLRAKINFNQYNWRVIGKILHNGIKSIDLPIIKPIKFI